MEFALKSLFAIFLLALAPSLFAFDKCLKKFEELNLRVEKKIEMGKRVKGAVKRRDRYRVKVLREYFHAGKEREYNELLWKSHDNFDVSDWERLRGRSLRREKLIQTLMVDNKNSYIPSYFKFYDQKDTSSVIKSILKNPRDADAEDALQEGLKTVDGWMSLVRNYRGDLEKMAAKAFRAREDLIAMNPYVDKGMIEKTWMNIFPEGTVDWFLMGKSYARGRGERKWGLEKFKGASRPSVEVRRSDGSVNRLNFPTLAFTGNSFNEKRDIIRHTFTQTFVDESLKKSLVYDRMTEQALMFQRLEYLHEALLSIPRSKRRADQQNLIDKIVSLLSTPGLQPRSDVVEKVQKRVMWAEFRAGFRVEKSSKRGFEGHKAKFFKSVSDVVFKSPLGKNIKFLFFGSALSTSLATLTYLILGPVLDSPWVQVPLAYPKFWWDYSWLVVFGDENIRECAKKPFWNSRCYRTALNKYADLFKIKQRISHDLSDDGRGFFHRLGFFDDAELYHMEDDELYQKVASRLSQLLADLRHDFRESEFYEAYDDSYMEGVTADLDKFMKGVFLHHYGEKIDDFERRYDELIEFSAKKEGEKAEEIMKEIRSLNEEAYIELKSYLGHRRFMVKFMLKVGVRPDGNSLEDIYEEMGIEH